MNSGRLNRRVRFERLVVDNSFDSAGSRAWEPVITLWAEVQDILPSRGENVADGVTITSRPARIRTRFRTDITSDMRIIYGSRILQIVGGPAELGNREGLELTAQEYEPAGNAA